MLRGKTVSGFEFEIDENVLDDYDFLELLCQIDEGETSLTVKMVDALLGKEQKEKLKSHVRKIEGRTSAKRLIAEVGEIFNSVNEIKN